MINFLGKHDFKGYTLILPSVSVGNVAQLSTDLIISTLSMKKIGILFDPSIIPMIGPSAFIHDSGITTASDLYVSEINKIVILQLRSPLISGLMIALFDKLTDFIKNENIERVIIITGSFAHEKHLVEASPFEYEANQFYDKYKNQLNISNWTETNNGLNHGSGWAKNFQTYATKKNIPSLILFKYVSEGDNIEDSVLLTDKINQYLKIMPIEENNGKTILTHPISWKHLYGNAPCQNIY